MVLQTHATTISTEWWDEWLCPQVCISGARYRKFVLSEPTDGLKFKLRQQIQFKSKINYLIRMVNRTAY